MNDNGDRNFSPILSISSLSITECGMTGHAFEMVSFLSGFINLRAGITWSWIFISPCSCMNFSTVSTAFRYKHMRPFDMRDANKILDGGISWHSASTYSSLVRFSKTGKTIAWSFFGKVTVVRATVE